MTSVRRQFERRKRKQRYLDYRDLYRQYQGEARAHGAQLPVPLLPKTKKARRALGLDEVREQLLRKGDTTYQVDVTRARDVELELAMST